jgi:hypothetical protein
MLVSAARFRQLHEANPTITSCSAVSKVRGLVRFVPYGPLVSSHVAELKIAMKKQVFRLNGLHRMTASVYKSDLDASIEYTARVMQQWHTEQLIAEAPTVEELRSMYTKYKTTLAENLRDVPILLWDPTLARRPQLDCVSPFHSWGDRLTKSTKLASLGKTPSPAGLRPIPRTTHCARTSNANPPRSQVVQIKSPHQVATF